MNKTSFLLRMFSIMVAVLLVLPFASCSDDSKEDGGENNTTDVAVTGNVVKTGLVSAVIESYFNMNLIPASQSIDGYGIEYSEYNDFRTSEKEWADELVGRKATLSLYPRDICPGTTYYYRANVELKSGLNYKGVTRTFKTLDLNNVVSSVSATDISLTRANLKGKYDGNACASLLRNLGIGRDSIDYIDIEAGILCSSDKETLKEDGKDVRSMRLRLDEYLQADNDEANDDFIWELDGLEPDTTYYYVPYTELNGVRVFGDIKSFTPSFSMKGGSIEVKDDTYISYTDATVYAKFNVDDNYLDECDKYLYYKKQGEAEYEYEYGYSLIDSEDKSYRRFNLHNLEQNTIYTYYVALVYRDNILLKSAEKTFTTKKFNGSATLEVSDVGIATATITATLANMSEEDMESYYLYMFRYYTSEGERSIEGRREGNIISASLRYLQMNTSYNYQLLIKKYPWSPVLYESAERTFTTNGVEIETDSPVDLGLSVKWATCNLGAEHPEEAGSLYEWTNSDAARNKLGKPWRRPTPEEFRELFEKCHYEPCMYKGTAGYIFIASNGNAIFLPEMEEKGYWTNYTTWSSSSYATRFKGSSSYDVSRSTLLYIRPVYGE